MSFILGVDRSQRLLLPESVEEYVSMDYPARFLDAFVEGRNLEVLWLLRKLQPDEIGLADRVEDWRDTAREALGEVAVS